MEEGVSGAVAERAGHTAPEPRPRWWRRGGLRDLLAVGTFVVMALFVTARYWRDPTGRLAAYAPDQTLFEWMLAHAARSLTHLENPFFTDRVGAPEGINVMGNTSVLGMAIPLTPITLLWGPAVAYFVMITFGFAATGVAWYFVLSRYAGLSRLAAFVGAAFCAFSPGMLSQGSGHPQIQAQFLLPVIVWRVFRLRSAARPVRAGVGLGLLIALQVFIGEETLFITAMVCAVITLAYAVARRRRLAGQVRPFLLGLGTAASITLVIVAYPLYQQFFGRRSYGFLAWIPNFRADLASYPAFSQLTLAGDPTVQREPLSQNVAELNSFFGWPLLVLILIITVWLWRDLRARIAAIVAVVFAALSLGHEINLNGEPTGVPGPWRLFSELPIFEVVVTTRFALVTAVAFGVLLALAVDRAVRSEAPVLVGLPRTAWVWLALIVAALAPLAPRPLTATGAPETPRFFTSGAYRSYVAADGAVTIVPPVPARQRDITRWAAAELAGFRITEGRFLTPVPGSPDKEGTLSRPATRLGDLAIKAGQHPNPPLVTEEDRQRVAAELRDRGVAILVMAEGQVNGDSIRTTMDALVGPGSQVQDMWVWDVRRLG
jgi:hypothetical protein